jgi:glycogen phosphorylase
MSNVRPAFTYTVRAKLPENLKFLDELAHNLWWAWNYDAVDLFRRVSRDLWEESNLNPVYLLIHAEQERLEYLNLEEGFLNHLARVEREFRKYMEEPRWFQKHFPERQNLQVAYFSAEFGISACLPIYSGGLGILAGDHLKTASDMGLPLAGVGLAYRVGYFHQYLNIDGWQQERYDENIFEVMPINKVLDGDGRWLKIDVPYLKRPVKAGVMRVDVGRVPLYVLTTNLQENEPEDRIITDRLYGGDREMRIRQEIVLGIGGVITLRAVGVSPTVCHMNEGHSAFLSLERIRGMIREQGLDFASAYEASLSGTCFTTHTPVPAGNDVFAEEQVRQYLEPMSADLGINWEQFAAIGRDKDPAYAKNYSMTVSAIRGANRVNGVSILHAHVARGMWQQLWPSLPLAEAPINAITNGVHLHSWISHDMATLFDRYLGEQWRSDPLREGLWNRVLEIPDEELWRTHELRRARLVAYARMQLQEQMLKRGEAIEAVRHAGEVLNPDALTIGFARRFATYKRATLLFKDIERLTKLVSDRDMPVQFIYAGKAHPRDDEGKKLIREIVHAVREEPLRHRVVFLEDYDIAMARYLVQGVDIWLNTPRRPLEASGTSGMKAVANGAIHLSILDGWWDEGYRPECGWAIGSGEEYEDLEYQDFVEGHALYDILEKEAVPLYYKRTIADIPREWITKMKNSMAAYLPWFSSHRMVRNYIEEAYLPSDEAYRNFSAEKFAAARTMAGWRASVQAGWNAVGVMKIEVQQTGELQVGDQLNVRAVINPGQLRPEDLGVEVYCGPVDSNGEILRANAVPMSFEPGAQAPYVLFAGTVITPRSGNFGLTVRILPKHGLLANKYATHLLRWA